MSELPASQLERFSLNELSPDERWGLSGLPYSRLPDTFSISTRIYKACLSIWDMKGSQKSPSRTDAAERAKQYFSRLTVTDPESARKFLGNITMFEKEVVVTEFGQQFYLDKENVIAGKIHEGKVNSLLLRNDLDGIPDSKSIAAIHKHPNDLPQSFSDLEGILSDMPGIPQRCLYFIIGPRKLHLMFPTLDTPRLRLEEVRAHMGTQKEKWIAEESLEYEELIKQVAQTFSLGFYTSLRTQKLSRI